GREKARAGGDRLGRRVLVRNQADGGAGGFGGLGDNVLDGFLRGGRFRLGLGFGLRIGRGGRCLFRLRFRLVGLGGRGFFPRRHGCGRLRRFEGRGDRFRRGLLSRRRGRLGRLDGRRHGRPHILGL